MWELTRRKRGLGCPRGGKEKSKTGEASLNPNLKRKVDLLGERERSKDSSSAKGTVKKAPKAENY